MGFKDPSGEPPFFLHPLLLSFPPLSTWVQGAQEPSHATGFHTFQAMFQALPWEDPKRTKIEFPYPLSDLITG